MKHTVKVMDHSGTEAEYSFDTVEELDQFIESRCIEATDGQLELI